MHCKSELEAALLRGIASEAQFITLSRESHGLMPWDRAKAIEAELQAGLPGTATSSAWVMLRAAKLWDDAAENMEQMKEMVTPTGTMCGGRLGVIRQISDAILTDNQVFRISADSWVEMYDKQLNIENANAGAWLSLSPQGVKQQALERQLLRGWDAVRPAVDITVRGWVVRAFSANRPGADPRLYLASYDSALEILDWGRTGPWKNVSTRDKGIVFENHFVRAMRRMRLDAFMSIVEGAERHGPEDIWKRIYDEAKSLFDETLEVGEAAAPHEPVFVLTYGMYISEGDCGDDACTPRPSHGVAVYRTWRERRHG
ncbi:hypothetical protein C8Q72DRAFT_809383 [Fomitopsis betulina]|nr:hypothetical protein C8Q72DRAFT_809383 [Fomitopsis betulina]